jgi:hypothetical protein
MTRTGPALRLALRDLYSNSWRLVAVNAAVGSMIIAAVVAAAFLPAGILLVVLAGPLAAALAHCAVTLVQTENLVLSEAIEGLRRSWRRGLTLGAVGATIAFVGYVAVRFYATRGSVAIVVAFTALYLLFLAGVFLLLLWPVAIAEPELPLREAARRTAELVARRPGATLGLGIALLLVNLAGIAAAVMPFLTLTVAYSFLAAAHFALPPKTPEETP